MRKEEQEEKTYLYTQGSTQMTRMTRMIHGTSPKGRNPVISTQRKGYKRTQIFLDSSPQPILFTRGPVSMGPATSVPIRSNSLQTREKLCGNQRKKWWLQVDFELKS